MSSKLLRRFGLAFFIGGIVLLAYWMFRPNPLVAGARRMVEAEQDGDGNTLFDATIEDERGCSDLSPGKIHRVWEVLIEPLVERSRLVEKVPVELETNQTQAVGTFRYITKEGDRWELTEIANQADEGVKTGVVYSMLAAASMFDEDGHSKPTLTAELCLNGLRRYRARLEGIGIHSIMLAPGNCVTLDKLEAKFEPQPKPSH